ncbi:MAG: hypothetical protein PGN29_10180 [Gordonia paraffinivorans]
MSRLRITGSFGLVALAVGVAGCGASPAPRYATAPSGSVSIAGLPAETPIPCDPSTATPGETVTRGPGDYRSALGVVADYHWSIITARDAARAKRAIRENQPMGTDRLIDDALTGFPVGSTYCIRMRQTAPDTVLLTLSTRPPGGNATSFALRATVDGEPGDMRIRGEVPQ